MPASVPTSDDHQALAATVGTLAQRIDQAEEAIATTARPIPHVLRPEDFGAWAGRDSTDAFLRMLDVVDRGLAPDAGGGVHVARHIIALGPGPYLISRPWMTPETGRAQGVTIRGLGKRSSEIVWSGEGPLLTNDDRWMGVRWRDLSFRSTTPDGSFLYSISTGACQDWGFFNTEWRGRWHYGIGLDGPASSNTNSEWRFDGCHVNGSYGEAFLWSGMSPGYTQQDQFLNFEFNGCKIEYDWGDFLRFDRGGYIRCVGGSYIIKSQRPSGGDSRFFHFPIPSHADAVRHLAVRDVRFELRHTTSKVIRSAWKAGHITFDNCSDTAHGFRPFSKDLVAHEYIIDEGSVPMIAYRMCDLVGRHRYVVGDRTGRGRVVYDQCTRKNNRTLDSFLIVEGGELPVTHREDGDGIRP